MSWDERIWHQTHYVIRFIYLSVIIEFLLNYWYYHFLYKTNCFTPFLDWSEITRNSIFRSLWLPLVRIKKPRCSLHCISKVDCIHCFEFTWAPSFIKPPNYLYLFSVNLACFAGSLFPWQPQLCKTQCQDHLCSCLYRTATAHAVNSLQRKMTFEGKHLSPNLREAFERFTADRLFLLLLVVKLHDSSTSFSQPQILLQSVAVSPLQFHIKPRW